MRRAGPAQHFRFSLRAVIEGCGRVKWAGSTLTHLAVDPPDVLGVEQHHLLVDEMRPEVATLLRAAAQRERGLVLLENPAASVGRPELRLHVAAGRTGCSSVRLCEPPLRFEADGGAAPSLAWPRGPRTRFAVGLLCVTACVFGRNNRRPRQGSGFWSTIWTVGMTTLFHF